MENILDIMIRHNIKAKKEGKTEDILDNSKRIEYIGFGHCHCQADKLFHFLLRCNE